MKLCIERLIPIARDDRPKPIDDLDVDPGRELSDQELDAILASVARVHQPPGRIEGGAGAA